jgi:AcrR family transcriptional regulator
MATRTKSKTEPRVPLSKERVLNAAVALADREDIKQVTMRNLAHELDVEAMSLYYHVENKEQLFDGMAETVIQEIIDVSNEVPIPTDAAEWRSAMKAKILLARDVQLRHKWAPGVLETRTTMSIPAIDYFHGLLAIFRAGGFSYDLAHHAMHALGSRALGFSQELFSPDEAPTPESEAEEAELIELMGTRFPLLMEMMGEIAHDGPDETIGWCDDQTEFIFALDVTLDGLDRINAAR